MTPDHTCQHGTALDVHCCNCHSGFIFDREHECQETTGPDLQAPIQLNTEQLKAIEQWTVDTRLWQSRDSAAYFNLCTFARVILKAASRPNIQAVIEEMRETAETGGNDITGEWTYRVMSWADRLTALSAPPRT